MVSSTTGDGITENASNPNAGERNEDGRRKKISEYEQSREERIRQNLERMQKLGIFDLSLKVKTLKPTPKARKTPSTRSNPSYSSPLPATGPIRRSSRLQNVTPVSYSETYLTKKDKLLESKDDLLREEGSKPEVYTDEHGKLLGSTEMSWTLFVDGVGKDGKRIYDQVKGKTCHQCRQKTLGYRTHCCKCNLVQGQFCGDCLYMRYGENVIEANQNLNWICPVCRGICNCSLCRQAKGWPPTGPLYRKISSLGYKSVAHYLIQTRRLETETEADSNSKVPASAKRSLPFTHVEEASTEMVLMDCNTNPQASQNLQPPENLPCDKQEEKTHFLDNEEGGFKQEEKTHFLNEEQSDYKEEEKTQFLDNKQGDFKLAVEQELVYTGELNAENLLHLGSGGKENAFLNKAGLPVSSHDQRGTLQNELEIPESNHEFIGKKEDETSYLGNSKSDCILTPESSPKSNKMCVRTIQPAGDRIAGRLRLRCNRDNKQEEHGAAKNGTPGVNQDPNGILPQHCVASSPESNKKRVWTIEPAGDSIAGRLRLKRNSDNAQEEHRLTGVENGILGVKQDLNGMSPQLSAEAEVNNSNSSSQATVTGKIHGRLRKRRAEGKEQEINELSSSVKAETGIDISSPVATLTSSKSKNKQTRTSKPSPDSIAGRLRERRGWAGGI